MSNLDWTQSLILVRSTKTTIAYLHFSYNFLLGGISVSTVDRADNARLRTLQQRYRRP